jgi:hypothetical protein
VLGSFSPKLRESALIVSAKLPMPLGATLSLPRARSACDRRSLDRRHFDEHHLGLHHETKYDSAGGRTFRALPGGAPSVGKSHRASAGNSHIFVPWQACARQRRGAQLSGMGGGCRATPINMPDAAGSLTWVGVLISITPQTGQARPPGIQNPFPASETQARRDIGRAKDGLIDTDQ